ncbi:MAG TPA: hypothetical protein PK253_02890 [Spirochaetota bacterium]|nr:hypothetical protein [Spirochaetota bacterium]
MKHVDTHERWIVVPKATPGQYRTSVRGLKQKKGNCLFDNAVPKVLIDFIFRAVVHLGVQQRTVIVVRGTVKRHGRAVRNAVSMKELPWGTGTLIVIPRRLRYRDCMVLQIDGREHEIRIMENIVLQALLRLGHPGMRREWYPDAAAVVLALGWKHLSDKVTHEIFRIRRGHAGGK